MLTDYGIELLQHQLKVYRDYQKGFSHLTQLSEYFRAEADKIEKELQKKQDVV